MDELLAGWDNGRLTVTFDTPYEVWIKTDDGRTFLQSIESGQGPIDKDLPITLDPGTEVDVVTP